MKDRLIKYHPRALRKYISEYNKEQRAEISKKIKVKRKEFSEVMKAERKGQKILKEIKIPKGTKKEGLVKLVLSRASMKIKAENDFKNKTALEGFEFDGEIMKPIKGYKKPKAEPKEKKETPKKESAEIATKTEPEKKKGRPAKKTPPVQQKSKITDFIKKAPPKKKVPKITVTESKEEKKEKKPEIKSSLPPIPKSKARIRVGKKEAPKKKPKFKPLTEEQKLLLEFVKEYAKPNLSKKKVDPMIIIMADQVVNDLANASGGSPNITIPKEYINYRYGSKQTENASWGDYSENYGLKNKENIRKTNEDIIDFINFYIKQGSLDFEYIEDTEPKFNEQYVINKLKKSKEPAKKSEAKKR